MKAAAGKNHPAGKTALEAKDRTELCPPILGGAAWQPCDLGCADTLGVGKSLALVQALFKAKLYVVVEFVEPRQALERVLGGELYCLRRTAVADVTH